MKCIVIDWKKRVCAGVGDWEFGKVNSAGALQVDYFRRKWYGFCGFGAQVLNTPLQTEVYEQDKSDLYYNGEPLLEDLLYEITGERERRKETMIEPRKISIEASDGKNYVGIVDRIEINPMNAHSMMVQAHVTDQEVGSFGIERVVFANPSTIVYWTDGSKTVVTCQDNVQAVKKKSDAQDTSAKKTKRVKAMPADTYSKEIGLAMCFAKKMLGNKGNYNDVFRRFIGEDEGQEVTK